MAQLSDAEICQSVSRIGLSEMQGRRTKRKQWGKSEQPKAHTARWTGGFPGHRQLGDWEGLGVEPKKCSGRDSKTGLFEWHPDAVASSVSPTGISLSYPNLNGQCFSKFIQRIWEKRKDNVLNCFVPTYFAAPVLKRSQCVWRCGLWSVRWEMESSFSSVTMTWKKLLLLVFSGLNCGKD